jgi:hypothetical protein
LGPGQQCTSDRIDVDDIVLTRLSALPDNARPRREKTVVFYSIEAQWEHELRGADKLYNVPTGAVFVVSARAWLNLAGGDGNIPIGRGIWLAEPR